MFEETDIFTIWPGIIFWDSIEEIKVNTCRNLIKPNAPNDRSTSFPLPSLTANVIPVQ